MQEDPITYHAYYSRLEWLDWLNYWTFITGLYKDHRKSIEADWYITYGLMFLGLYIEKTAINWLTNRWGCTYNKLQKLLELDVRYKMLEEDKLEVPAPYGPHRYREHYFYHNFDDLVHRLVETDVTADANRVISRDKNDDYSKEVRDFIPHKVAFRIK